MPAYTADNIALGIIAEGRRSRSGEGQKDHPVISEKGIKIALATGLVESNLKMYANEGDPPSMGYPHDGVSSDANSTGVFQQRSQWWGTVEDRMDVARSAALFYNSLFRQRVGRTPTFDGFDYNSDNISPGSWAQMVQRSDYPERYDERWPEAEGFYMRLGGPAAPAPPPVATPTPTLPNKPAFTELEMFGRGASSRSRPPINFFIHTEEGNGSAQSLAEFCQGQNNVSYHYTVRDGIVYDVVDTDLYSWSVLDANVFSINLCFAGSRVAMGRDQWLERERDIEIAAYIAVQDTHKYNFATDVIAPPYHEASGISDHKYVTEQLGIGTHTDVGNNFPWDVFAKYVAKYVSGASTEEDWLSMPSNEEKLDFIWNEMRKRGQSRSIYRKDNEPIETMLGFNYNQDAMLYDGRVEDAARHGEDWALEAVTGVAAGTAAGAFHWWDPNSIDQEAIDHAVSVLDSVDDAVLTAWNERRKR